MTPTDYALDALDPSRLMSRLGRVPDPWQRDLLADLPHRGALLACRQVGKGEVLMTAGLHTLAYRPNSVVAILTPSLRQSCRLLRRIRRSLHAVPHVEAVNKAVGVLQLSNGSEAVAWPGGLPDSLRGDTLDLLLIDEGAWVIDDAWTAALPMLAMSRGKALAASTPGGPSGYLHSVFTDPDLGLDWSAVTVRGSDCPRYSPADLAALRRALGERGYATEVECEWREGADSVFSAADIARILGTEVVPDQVDGEDPLPEEDVMPYESMRSRLSRLAAS